uniref:C-type lectin domain-containing protein n=1 Tax=Panagrolaimus sp. ES5 TaxID=591445 RepID=A0AC34GHD2_9BILA
MSKTYIEQTLDFLAYTTNGKLGYIILDQRVLHDKATRVGCAITQCTFQSGGFVNGTIIKTTNPLTMLLCTFDVNWFPIPVQPIYGARNNASTTTEPPVITTTTEIVTQPPTTTTPPYNPCSAGWFYYANACYRYVDGSATRTYAQAEQWCINQGKKGHLVSIHSEAENNFVKSKQLVSDLSLFKSYI